MKDLNTVWSHFKSRLSLIVRVNIVLNRTVVVDSDWRFDNLCGSHLQSQSELCHVSWWYYTLVIVLIGQLRRVLGTFRSYSLNDGKSHVFIAYLIFSLKEHHQYIPVLLHLLTLFITSISLTRSVSSIERVNSVIVPLLLLVLVVSFYWSLTLEYASHGISFLFSPDWGKYSCKSCNAVAWCQHWFP